MMQACYDLLAATATQPGETPIKLKIHVEWDSDATVTPLKIKGSYTRLVHFYPGTGLMFKFLR